MPPSVVGLDVSNQDIQTRLGRDAVYVAFGKFFGTILGYLREGHIWGQNLNYLENAAPDRPVPSSVVGFDVSNRVI